MVLSGEGLRGDGYARIHDGEFDPGSGRTLAAGLIHASRTRRFLRKLESGERVRNAYATYLLVEDNRGKLRVILHVLFEWHHLNNKAPALIDGHAFH